MSEELVSLGEALFHYHLQRVVIVRGIAAQIVDLLCPSEFLEERFSLVRGETSESHDGCLIGIVGHSITSEHMGTFIPYIAGCQRERRGDLMLYGDVPSVQRGQPDLVRKGESANLVGKPELSGRWDRDERGSERPFERLKTLSVFEGGLSCCVTSTGRFCVAV